MTRGSAYVTLITVDLPHGIPALLRKEPRIFPMAYLTSRVNSDYFPTSVSRLAFVAESAFYGELVVPNII
jgi:hypothetical protein